jgi:Xaa-Pro dipeptidase
MQKELKSKLERIFSKAANVDSIVLVNTNEKDPNFTYITGFTSGIFEDNFLILRRDRVKLITNPLEYEAAISQKVSGLEVVKSTSGKETIEILKSELNKERVGINEDFLVYSYYGVIKSKAEPSKIVPVAKAFSASRLIKSASEIKRIKEAAEITKRAQKEILSELREGMTEKELAKKFDDLSGRLGSDKPSFDTIVCFGANASMPHHSPDNTKLKDGDLVLIDAGSKVGNYCSDITRTTIFARDSLSARQAMEKEEMISIVKEAQRKAIDAIKPGVKASDIHKIAADHIDSAANGKYKGTFIHSLGHSLGIEVHDGAGLSPASSQRLEPNMVVTVEPGIYVSGVGGVRIEDDVVVTKSGSMIL